MDEMVPPKPRMRPGPTMGPPMSELWSQGMSDAMPRPPQTMPHDGQDPRLGMGLHGFVPGRDQMKVPKAPEGLPLEFYREPGAPFGGPNPMHYMRPTPSEQKIYDRDPEIFGRPVAGLLESDVPGRTDQLPINVEPGSYVIPADVVSGLGQGNTSAGAKLVAQIMPQQRRADGGAVVPIVAAGGEYIVPPSAVASLGGGDVRKGQDALDKMVRSVRIAVAKRMLKLPGPRRD